MSRRLVILAVCASLSPIVPPTVLYAAGVKPHSVQHPPAHRVLDYTR
jgi:hypothetical protein